MRHMSFALTTEQVRRQEKTVTRRLGWRFATVGMVVQPIVKGQGLKKGERVETVGGPIRFVRVDRVPLNGPTLTFGDVSREGFHGMGPSEFIEMFCKHNRPCQPLWLVTRIEFEYLP